MMMDDELDDLFGDRQLGEITDLPPLSTHPRGLVQRLDDLRTSGCSQYVRFWLSVEVQPECSQKDCLVHHRLCCEHCPRRMHRHPSQFVL